MNELFKKRQLAMQTPVGINTAWGSAKLANGESVEGILIRSTLPKENSKEISTRRLVLILNDAELKFIPHKGGKTAAPNGLVPKLGANYVLKLKKNHVYSFSEVSAKKQFKNGTAVRLIGLDYSLYAKNGVAKLSLNAGLLTQCSENDTKRIIDTVSFIKKVDFEQEDLDYKKTIDEIISVGTTDDSEDEGVVNDAISDHQTVVNTQHKYSEYETAPVGVKFKVNNNYQMPEDIYQIKGGQVCVGSSSNPAAFEWCLGKKLGVDIPENLRVKQMCLGAASPDGSLLVYPPGPLPYVVTQLTLDGDDFKGELICVFLTLYAEDLNGLLLHPINDLNVWKSIGPYIQKHLVFNYVGGIDKNKTKLIGGLEIFDYACVLNGRATINLKETLLNVNCEITSEQCMQILSSKKLGFDTKHKHILHGSYTLNELKNSVISDKDSICLLSNMKNVNLKHVFDSGKCRFYMVGNDDSLTFNSACKHKLIYAMTVDDSPIRNLLSEAIDDIEEEEEPGAEEKPKKKVKTVL